MIVQVASLPLTEEVEEGTVVLAAVVVLKVLTTEGVVAYQPGATADLTTVEALGMTQFAQLRLAKGLLMNDEGEA